VCELRCENIETLPAADSVSQRGFSMTPLRQQMTEDMQVRNLSPRTQAYPSSLQRVARRSGETPSGAARRWLAVA
jgi:hypothetical protein